MTEDEEKAARQRLDELGPDQVRTLLSHGGLPTQWNSVIHDWLGKQDQKRSDSK